MKYQYFEVCEHVAVHAAHHGHELGGELEGGALEAEVLGRAGEDEAVVDVDEVTLAVQEDVAVVTIFHLDRYIFGVFISNFLFFPECCRFPRLFTA